MTVRQLYYTSYSNKVTGSAGFQIKAMTPEISSDLQEVITRLIAYRIPPSLDARAIEGHPQALRYYYNGPGECILLCSQSNGNDENGRPGNFFAHVLILEEELFTSIPPIFFWKSPFWCSKDREERAQIVSLPLLPAFDEEPLLDVEEIWRFIDEGNRRNQLYKLLCAVVHSGKTQRRIVILDSIEHIVLWIAAVSCLLPPDYRPLLSFATYHHDPYQAQYIITGTTSDSSFHASPEEYMSYFILNAETGVTSAIEPSPYAEMAAEAARADRYETDLLPFFSESTQRFPRPTLIDEQLDQMVYYNQMQHTQLPDTVSANHLEAIEHALTSFERLQNYKEEDIQELARLEKILRNAAKTSATPVQQSTYKQTYSLLQGHGVPTDAIILEELKYHTQQLTQPHTQADVPLVQSLGQTFETGQVLKIVNSPDYLSWLAWQLKAVPINYHIPIWRWICTTIQPGEDSGNLLRISLTVAAQLQIEQRFNEMDRLLRTIAEAVQQQGLGWLQEAVKRPHHFLDSSLPAFYYVIVQPLPLEQRLIYRRLLLAEGLNILNYEISNDIHSQPVPQQLAKLELWIKHARLQGYKTEPLVQAALQQVKLSCTTEEWGHIVPQILKNELLAPLPEQLEKDLVQQAFATFSLDQFSVNDLELYKKYQRYPTLSSMTRVVLNCIMAITSGQLSHEQSQQLCTYIMALDLNTYIAVVKRCLTEFFQHDVAHAAHREMIQALFYASLKHEATDFFWQEYQETLISLLIQPASVKRAIQMLDFWFTTTPGVFREGYPVQHFFLLLPTHELIQKGRGIQRALDDFNTMTQRYSWSASLQNIFSEQKNIITTLGQNVFTHLQKYRRGQESEGQTRESQENALLTNQIASLFKGKESAEQHYQQLPRLYTSFNHEQFWSAYWQRFTEALTSCNAELVLTLFAFWFDRSPELWHVQYLSQEFFLGLYNTIEQASKHRGFRETADALNKKVLASGTAANLWYKIVGGLLITQI